MLNSQAVHYQRMSERATSTIDRRDTMDNAVATIDSWSNNRSTPNHPPPDYSSVILNQPSTSVVQMHNCAVAPGEAYIGQPHDLDYGTLSHTGTLNLLAMSEIRLKTRTPMEITCPHCYMPVVTMLQPTRGVASYLGFVLLILCGCILGCCLIPLYWTAFLDIKHFCPHCHKLIGVAHVF